MSEAVETELPLMAPPPPTSAAAATGETPHAAESASASSAAKPSSAPKKKATSVPVFASFGAFSSTPTRIKVVWTVLRGAALAALVFSVLLRIGDVVGLGFHRQEQCSKVLSRGHWTPKKAWHPDSCAIAKYQPNNLQSCLGESKVLLIGDSSMRAIYYAFRAKLGAKLTETEKANAKKHEDLSYTSGKVHLEFYWDPWLNRTDVLNVLDKSQAAPKLGPVKKGDVAALVVLEPKDYKTSIAMVSVGAWFMRYGGDQPAAIENFGKTVSHLFDIVTQRHASETPIATHFITRLLPPFEEAKLSKERQAFLHNELRLQYNAKLFKLVPGVEKGVDGDAFKLGMVGLHALTAAEGMTTDGLHYLPEVDAVEVELLLNQVCNEPLYNGTKQQGKTSCCVDYPKTPAGVWAILVLVLAFGPGAFYYRTTKPHFEPANATLRLLYPTEKTAFALGVLGLVLISCLTVDRSTLFVKVNKEFNSAEFVLMNLAWIVPGFWSLRVGSDSTFLNREQTDEWKGWMQFAILVYHFTGGSKVIPIYAVIRIMVASYLFMTGFGHFTFFYKKADFSLIRLARVLVRLNLLSIALSYVMETDTLFYYFGPLVTFWFMIVYGTMGIYSAGNSNPTILATKLFLSNLAAYSFTHFPIVYGPFFQVCETLFGVKWNAKEAAFRLALDQYAVHFGMLCAWLMISLQSVQSSTPTQYNWLTALSTTIVNRWAQVKRTALISSTVILITYTIFISTVKMGKTENNAYHPYISLVILSAFVILRNATESLRKTTSVFWRWIGGFSLETFILQYHIWLAVDTYAVVDLLGPGVIGRGTGSEVTAVVKWFGFLMNTVVFFALSEVVGDASGVLVEGVVIGGLGKGADARGIAARLGVWMLVLVLWNYTLV
ncbi:Cas1p-domain-containing protein [Rhizoclosmatium globosum]|uniref:Cas1p-domain-containing protein n=1 Tax=Rhizoclosmatium globosum TaxID=329046 RepID=A0A1Y2B9L1_9FUNG|nr:Cas1p-domain-containing protein [Rhizoclosmatium globosum]|eukprot:ORY31180.1 Cas1p-domain-containing protein [Rhizoclosmatium globosum]